MTDTDHRQQIVTQPAHATQRKPAQGSTFSCHYPHKARAKAIVSRRARKASLLDDHCDDWDAAWQGRQDAFDEHWEDEQQLSNDNLEDAMLAAAVAASLESAAAMADAASVIEGETDEDATTFEDVEEGESLVGLLPAWEGVSHQIEVEVQEATVPLVEAEQLEVCWQLPAVEHPPMAEQVVEGLQQPQRHQQQQGNSMASVNGKAYAEVAQHARGPCNEAVAQPGQPCMMTIAPLRHDMLGAWQQAHEGLLNLMDTMGSDQRSVDNGGNVGFPPSAGVFEHHSNWTVQPQIEMDAWLSNLQGTIDRLRWQLADLKATTASLQTTGTATIPRNPCASSQERLLQPSDWEQPPCFGPVSQSAGAAAVVEAVQPIEQPVWQHSGPTVLPAAADWPLQPFKPCGCISGKPQSLNPLLTRCRQMQEHCTACWAANST